MSDPYYEGPDDIYADDSNAGYDSPSTEEIAAAISTAVDARLQQYGQHFTSAYAEQALIAADTELAAHFGEQWEGGLRDKALERWRGLDASSMMSPFQVAESLKVAAYDQLYADAKGAEEKARAEQEAEWRAVKSAWTPNPWVKG